MDEPVREALALFDAAAIERESPQLAQSLAARHDHHHGPGYWRALVDQIGRLAEPGLGLTEADLRRITVPTLLIAGEADAFNGMEKALAMRRSIPDSELLILNRAGLDGMGNHRVQATRPEVVGPVILDFLARHSAAASDVAS